MLVVAAKAYQVGPVLQDVKAGRRTEVDCLNDAVVRMGQGRVIATPDNDALANLVGARETRVAAAASACDHPPDDSSRKRRN